MLAAAKKRIEGHYDVQEVPFGTVYKWHPKRSFSKRVADHEASASAVSSTLGSADAILHPWRYTEDREDAGLPC